MSGNKVFESLPNAVTVKGEKVTALSCRWPVVKDVKAGSKLGLDSVDLELFILSQISGATVEEIDEWPVESFNVVWAWLHPLLAQSQKVQAA